MTNQNNDDIDDEEDTLRKIKETIERADVLNEPSPLLNESLRRYIKYDMPREIQSTLDDIKSSSVDDEPGPLLALIRDYLKSEGWDFDVQAPRSTIYFGFEGVNGQWHCMIQTREEERQAIFYSNFESGLEVTGEEIQNMMAFITMVNYRLVIGNFEMDLSDGEVNYKTSIDCDGAVLSSELIRNLLHLNLATFDRHIPGMEAIVNGDPPGDALDKVTKTETL